MKAVIFAAGLGTRLSKYTRNCPKALVTVHGQPMLLHVIEYLRAAGIHSFVINVHSFADMVESTLEKYCDIHPDIDVQISDERSVLLETGGGLRKMERFLQDGPFLVHNVDILTNMDMKDFLHTSAVHSGISSKTGEIMTADSACLATLAVRKTESDRYFLFNKEGLLCGWENIRTGEQKIARPQEKDLERYGFMGIHYICPAIFPLLTEKGVFSITNAYLRLAEQYEIRMSDQSKAEWIDIGTPEQLQKAEAYEADTNS